MGTYNIGEVWWTSFPYEEKQEEKHRPAVVIDENTIGVLAMMVTSKEKKTPFYIEINDWKEAGLTVPSWARIDRVVRIDEWHMDHKIGELSQNDLLKIMQLFTEIQTNHYHEFSLIAIKNAEGKYLQLYDENWNCWLFPYFKTADPNKENVDNKLSELIGITVETRYVAQAIHCKFSVKDEVYKAYRHKLYALSSEYLPENMKCDSFELNANKYAWMSIKELEADSDVMAKNDDVLAFVKVNCS